ncbi:hypothetical protein RHABOEDO_001394 [Candidatus Rhabdochlamydia oedothoracis]|uniref:Myosin heavy chain n=2 Tax=Candidatus Rhabdochlamydia oedothoracis TaxID=2720720 RepID=A0ABX8V6B3_9BACT|nr:hypothetical protein [Candidatus Rhabdochlamydia sp. W815]KAG6559454.1 hypothetical protein RHOW815_000540 [Candidatus Rhabdochlamydia sp. W815]QYF49122.1 hypothetical protein RHABOEDO_001394 [Candidatus Rhabdochlamydia oedothoracis]
MNSDHDMKGESGKNFSNESIAELTAKQKQSEKDNSQGDVSDAYPNDMNEKNSTHSLIEFLEQFHGEIHIEKKIRLSLEFMRQTLSQGSSPRFKDFWEVRKICLSLFKEDMPISIRADLWNSYIELASEAKQLKEIVDQQSAFAVEQIELAIQALEKDVADMNVVLELIADVVISEECFSLQKNRELYATIQRELQLLNALAVKINSLRKELLKTEMRIRIKNKLLERLSLCGNQVFPRRKELIKQISEQFSQDVECFVYSQFREKELTQIPGYVLRKEIKYLQQIAKVLTLNTHVFTETRVKLSTCWDEIKNYEKERKKETQEKKLLFKQGFDQVAEKIQAFVASVNEETSLQECDRQITEILAFIKTVLLGREEVQMLKEQLYNVKKPILEKAREAEKIHTQKLQEKEKEKKDRLEKLSCDLKNLIQQASELSLEQITLQNKALEETFQQNRWKQSEKQMLERLFKQVKDLINDNKEKTLMLLSEDDQKALAQLQIILFEKKNRCKELKDQLEQYRKLLGGSGLDFEKTIMYRELVETDKSVLKKINTSILDIEKKIKKIAEMEI